MIDEIRSLRAKIDVLEYEKEQLVQLLNQLLYTSNDMRDLVGVQRCLNELKTPYHPDKYEKYKDAKLKFGGDPF